MASVMAPASVPSGESTNATARITSEGKKITYHLNVVQQPERARACGQGAKSSSDRRPVDPPPIVQLRVCEGDESRDITFTYNANFFLFATLEHARPMSQGCYPPPQTSPPILAGSPVAGMSYLDRPNPAGYFIFPDLSVRHEGKYRLVFMLYEEVKDAKDGDGSFMDQASTHPVTRQASHVNGRCDVRSAPFDVFSAKKFPGLAESTHLSRTVADQGCRVRIRRDVRMRRRDSKHGKDWDGGDAEPNDDQSEAEPRTPNTIAPQSAEGAHQSQVAYDRYSHMKMPDNQAPRFLPHQQPYDSQQHFQQPYAQQSAQPYGPQTTYDQHQNPQCGSAYSTAPTQQMTQQMNQMPQQFSFGYSPSNGTTAAQMTPTYAYMAPQQPPQQQPQMQQAMYGPQSTHQYPHMASQPSPTSTMPPTFTRASDAQGYTSQAQLMSPLGTSDSHYGRPMSQHQMMPPPSTLPPYSNSSYSGMKALPPLTEPSDHHQGKNESASPMSATVAGSQSGYGNAVRSLPASILTNGGHVAQKRSYGAAFDTTHMDQPMHAGARPMVDGVSEEDSEEELQDPKDLEITYRRADGTVALFRPRIM